MEFPCAGFPYNVSILVHSKCWDASRNVTTILSPSNDRVSNGLGLTWGSLVPLRIHGIALACTLMGSGNLS